MQRRIGDTQQLSPCAFLHGKHRKKEIMLRTRLESDSIGSMMIPADVYYGVQALRANRNFQITGQNMNPEQVKDLFEKSLAGEITENPDETGK